MFNISFDKSDCINDVIDEYADTVYKLASIVILLVCSGGISAFAYHLTGGDFFRELFIERINHNVELEGSSADFKQIDDMLSNTVGTVVNTDEITVDVMGLGKFGR